MTRVTNPQGVESGLTAPTLDVPNSMPVYDEFEPRTTDVETTPASPPSNVAPVSDAITTVRASAAFTPLAGRAFHLQLTGNATCQAQLQRCLDGVNWTNLTVTSSGTTTQMYNWSYSGLPLSEDLLEAQAGVQYRVYVSAITSGELDVRFSQ